MKATGTFGRGAVAIRRRPVSCTIQIERRIDHAPSNRSSRCVPAIRRAATKTLASGTRRRRRFDVSCRDLIAIPVQLCKAGKIVPNSLGWRQHSPPAVRSRRYPPWSVTDRLMFMCKPFYRLGVLGSLT